MEQAITIFPIIRTGIRSKTNNTQRFSLQSWITHNSFYHHGNRGIIAEERKETTIQNKESLKNGSVFRPIHFPIHIQ